MGRNFLSVPHKGLRDWSIQRLSAIYLAAYTIYIMVCAFALPASFKVWHNMFANFWLVIINSLMLFCLMGHIWVGAWTVVTDYVKPPIVRNLLKMVVIFLIFACLLWGLQIFWHIHELGYLH